MKKQCTFQALLLVFVSFLGSAQIKPVTPDSIKASAPVFSLFAQDHVPKPPKTVQSPNVATLGSYGEIAVSPFTGKAEINIDLCAVASGDVQIPVTLHYDAAGVRPDVHPGWTGLNFGLSTNYAVVRTIRDGPDEFNVPGVAIEQLGFFFTNSVINGNNWKAADEIRKTALTISKQPGAQTGTFIDTEPDEYSFNAPGLSGKFFYGSDGQWKVQCERPVKVELITQPNVHLYTPFAPPSSIKNGNQWTNLGHYMEHFQGFVITDEFGTQYIFGGGDMSAMEYSLNFFEQGSDGWICNAWQLKSIVRYTGQTIGFTYERGDFVSQMYFSVYNKMTRINGGAWFTCDNWSSLIGQYGAYSGKLISPVYLKDITSENFKLKFLSSESTELRYTPDIFSTYANKKIQDGFSKLDFLTFLYDCYYPAQVNYPGGCGNPTLDQLLSKLKWRKLDKIQVENGAGATIREFEFTYNNIATERLMLQKVQEKSAYNVSKLPAYEFKYFNNGYTLPAYCKSHTDHWGFNNGKPINVLNDYSALASYGTNFRSPPADENVYRAAALTEIKYPTGGVTKFYFEPHKYAKEVKLRRWEGEDAFGANQLAGGLRIKEVTSFDPASTDPVVVKKYYYLATFDPAAPDTSATALSSGVLGGKAQYYWPDYKPQPDGPGISVEEDIFSTQSVLPASENAMGSHIGYSQVIERSSAEGWTVYHFSNFDNGYRDGAPEGFLQTSTTPYQPCNNQAFTRGKTLSTAYYNQSGSIASRTTQIFNFVGPSPEYTARAVKTQVSYLCGTANTVFEGTAYLIDCRKFLPTEVASYTYDQDNAAVTPGVQGNTFWPNGQLYISAQSDSRSRNIKTSFQYPSSLPDAISTGMKAKHMIGPVMEKLQYTGTEAAPAVIRSTRFGYSLFAGLYQPQNVEVKSVNAPFFTKEIEYLSYDVRGNLLSFQTQHRPETKLEYYGVADLGKTDLLKNMTTAEGTSLARTTTYNYKPGIGVASMQDANAKGIFYEYDYFNRLKNIHADNAAGALRASYCYNLAGQIAACAALSPTGSVGASPLLLIAEAALPVILIEFTAGRHEQAVLLQWSTTEEINAQQFEIERSADGKTWTSIGSVPARGGTESHSYTFTDLRPLAGENLYRLKMMDADSTFTYSRMQSVVFTDQNLLALYPNPLTVGSSLHIETEVPGQIRLVQIYDQQGKIVLETAWREAIDIRQMLAGLYVVRVSFADGRVTSRRIVKK